MSENKYIGFIERPHFGIDVSEVVIFRKIAHDPRAELAIQLIERWGLVASEPDGKDSDGRQKMKLLAPADIIERAVETAGRAFVAFEREGWLLEAPEPKPGKSFRDKYYKESDLVG